MKGHRESVFDYVEGMWHVWAFARDNSVPVYSTRPTLEDNERFTSDHRE